MDPLHNIPRLSELSGHLLRLPIADRRKFATLISVSDIQAWTTAKADEYRQFALALLAIHNLAAPIHRLPVEALELILEQCWEDWKSLRLPHVCRLWRSILLGNAAFWADAVANCELREKRDVVHNQLPLIDTLLSRSTLYSHTIKPSFYNFTPSILVSLTPYINNVVSLQVAVGKGDMHERLWPLLLSGMPNLEALEIQLMITKEELSRYHEEDMDAGDIWSWYSGAWSGLTMLSHDNLPKLFRLTCPHNMTGCFGGVSLKHLKVEWRDRSEDSDTLHMPPIALGKPEGLYLEPYRDCLETLEVMPIWIHHNPYAPAPPGPLTLSCLRHLRIASTRYDDDVSRVLSWLLVPQTTFIHITKFNSCNSVKLCPIVSTIDHLRLQQLPPSDWPWSEFYWHMQGFAGNIERLRIDAFNVGSSRDDNLVQVFGENAPVTRLVLSALSPESGGIQGINLHAFPHLVHFDVGGSNIEITARMLQLDTGTRNHWYRAGQAAESSHPCLRLAELVITCGPLVHSTSGGCTDPGTVVDELFQQQCAVLQRILADRASHGATRLTYLALNVRPTTILSDSAWGMVPDIGADERGEKRKVDAQEEVGWGDGTGSWDDGRPGLCQSDGPENHPDSSSSDLPTDKPEATKSEPIWPGHAARRSAESPEGGRRSCGIETCPRQRRRNSERSR